MSALPSPAPDSRLRVSVEDLCDVLDRLRELHEQLLVILAEQQKALVDVRVDDIEILREREEELLRLVIDEEKERLIVTEEVGDLIRHDPPASVRILEILPHVDDRLGTRLDRNRERLQEVALRLSRQNSTGRALIEHSIDHIQIFLSRVAQEEMDGRLLGESGSEPDHGGGAFPRDRHV